MNLTSKDVLKPLAPYRFPKTPEQRTQRVREFVSLFIKYRAQTLASNNGDASPTLLLDEAQRLLREGGVAAAKKILDEELERSGYQKVLGGSTNKDSSAKTPEEEALQTQTRLAELRPIVSPILEHPDPLILVSDEVRAGGYGGDLTAVKITYISTTTRLLPLQDGHKPCHTAHVAPSGEGKSYALGRVLKLLPECAYYLLDATSPKTFVHDPEPLKHRVLVFGEIDSIPEGEDSPIASAIRTLLSEGRVVYKYVAKNLETGRMEVISVAKDGPTTLLTTATRNLDGKQGSQMDTRLYSLSIPETLEQHAAALEVIAAKANEEVPRQPNTALVAYQEYLQLQAPWRVVVPYAATLAKLLRPAASRGRIMRDFERLLSFIKAVAILRHAHRERTPSGSIVATLEDYTTVRQLLGAVFAGAATGATEELRLVVDTVAKGGSQVTRSELVEKLAGRLGRDTIVRHVLTALREGWLVDEGEGGRGHAWALTTGLELPTWGGLPRPEEVTAGVPS